MGKKKKKAKVKKLKPVKAEGKIMKPKLILEEQAYRKIMYWIDKAPGEVSGLGTIEFKDNTPHLTDAILLLQENTGTSTDLDPESVNLAMFEHHRDKKPGHLNFWWHSHVNMGVFWSGTDTSTIADLGAGGWFISTVFNKKREMKTAFYQTNPLTMFVDDVQTEIGQVMSDELKAELDFEYEQKCKVKSYSDIQPYLGSYGNKDYSRGYKERYNQETKSWEPVNDRGSSPAASQVTSRSTGIVDATTRAHSLTDEDIGQGDIEELIVRQQMRADGYTEAEIDNILDADEDDEMATYERNYYCGGV